MTTPTTPPAAHRHFSLFGAPGTNSNLGLNALMRGTLTAAMQYDPGAGFTVFDNQLGSRRSTMTVGSREASFDVLGARLSRRVTRAESFTAMRAAVLVRGRGNAGARAVLDSTAVLDVSGGDSFSDIYGWHRFRTVCAPKRLALAAKRPLVLLPQTYGPFADPKAAEEAKRLVLASTQAWARDPDSFAGLRALLGSAFDPERHLDGVDLAVLLQPETPGTLTPPLAALLDSDPRPIGVNVSGLLWNHAARFGLTADYRRAMSVLVQRLADGDSPVVLVPHVLGSKPGMESDNIASEELVASLPERTRARVHVVEGLSNASHAKWIIRRCAWFIGGRMHATIAALSSGVPCAAVAYSHKFRGVFATMGAPDGVLDARGLTTQALVEAALESYSTRADTRERLETQLPVVTARAQTQISHMLDAGGR